ncbi:hypothetical protein BCT30_14790 [Enterovibrio norvegicus]|uniref:hypothetical protein n=1 Tax=Enterovibrio norvegicus TaxID=188144 RepID=UPI000C82C1E0|nr:hypothetical protein [Enterovibrio norvegicus]MCC4796905.1 hypothetical protein [Enterovibrio norvegicus]PMI32576.1 hypothetical protein BCU47_12475 [Enterovibrio norvegicus]PMI37625.1 hypothetical protein BCU46_11235 [Enterovibrio norvegicus]PMN51341.1 hypothetical protein BCT30_14790 [Enterovibrio norvegicus]TKF13416.1 hypothetical protein FCV66_13700 [Enterovibrio norvegicus]
MAEQLVAVIEKRKQWIADERQRLEAYAKAQAKKSCQCPKRGGTGVTRVVDTCSGCGGVTLKADGVEDGGDVAGE